MKPMTLEEQIKQARQALGEKRYSLLDMLLKDISMRVRCNQYTPPVAPSKKNG